MTLAGWAQILVFCAIVVALAKPLGAHMTRVFEGERTFLSPILSPVERAFYALAGIDPKAEQRWTGYAASMLALNFVGFLALYAVLRLQDVLPLNPQGMSALSPDLSLNTAVSFTTNTDWQSYGGEVDARLFRPDDRADRAELPFRRNRHRAGCRHDPWICPPVGKRPRQFLGRHHALHALHPAANLPCVCDLPGLAGHAAEPVALCGRNHARRRQADHRARARRLADRDQDARHQWRRLLQC